MKSKINRKTLFGDDARTKFQRFFAIMLPILITQSAIMGMNFVDTVMSGRAGAEQLAGTSIGGNLWMPIFTTINGILVAATPLTAHLSGAGKRSEIGRVIRYGLLLAVVFSLLCFVVAFFFLRPILGGLGLEPVVAHIATYYLAGIGIGVIPFFMGTVLRSLVDTLGGTRLTMQVYLAALPINAFLNYVLIFGKLGLPALGGIGAGIGTGLTCWLIFGMFYFIVTHTKAYRDIQILPDSAAGQTPERQAGRQAADCGASGRTPMQPATTGPGKRSLDWEMVKEYLRIGVPIGLAIFMETSIFGVVAFLVAKFGTAAIAASQAAMSFSSLVYMLPLSVSMSMTIIIGTEAGRKAWLTAEQYENVGLAFNWLCALILPGLCFLLRYPIARMYITDPEIVLICVQFIVYSCIFMMGDAVAAPIQGILRGYKDVKAPFYSALVAYWGICAPVGLFFDYVLQHGPYSYWQSLDFGLFTSAVILFFRLLYIRKKLRRDNALL